MAILPTQATGPAPAGSAAHLADFLARRRGAMREQVREVRAKRRSRSRRPPRSRTWLTVDGEGWGVDEMGRQCYRFLAAATDDGFEAVCWGAGPRMTTGECLEFLCSLPAAYLRWARRRPGLRAREPRVVGFALGYDHAHWLLDVDLEQLRALFHQQDFEAPLVWYEASDARYGLKLTAGRLEVKKFSRGHEVAAVTIWDSFKYFQSAFLRAADRAMREDERPLVEAGKLRRGDDEHDPRQEERYALTECRVHSRLMAMVEEEARALDLQPTSWYGPGSLATLALQKQGVGECHLPDSELPPALAEAAARAFVGGRFEATGHGRLPVLFENDINSAYPYGTSLLPCLRHAHWEHFSGDPGGDEYWALYHVRWSDHGKALKGGWGPWPSRVQPTAPDCPEGTARMLPVWPWSGEAWVWGPEFRAGAELLKLTPTATFEVLEAWVPERRCECRPFSWVPEWYEHRRQLKAEDDPRQMWVKLILNSLYGKLAQQVGRAEWHSFCWAGMVTAQTRSMLLRAIAQDPEAVVMTATDAVYSLRPLTLPVSEALGEWGQKILTDVLVVQSGFLSSAEFFEGKDHPRTRGLPARYVDWQRFNETWDQVLAGDLEWSRAQVLVDRNPQTGEPFQVHVGLGLAQLWGKPEMLGRWIDYPTQVSFLTDKRPQLWEGPRPHERHLPPEERYRRYDSEREWWEREGRDLAEEHARYEVAVLRWETIRERVLFWTGIRPDRDYPAREIPRPLRGSLPADEVASACGFPDAEALLHECRAAWTNFKAARKPAGRPPRPPVEPLPWYGQGWIYTRPWQLAGNAGSEYRAGRGQDETRFLVPDQPNATEWGSVG